VPTADEKPEVEEHQTSLAVWDLGSPLVISRAAKMKVGAKCSAGCTLTDQEIEIQDQSGAKIAHARLGANPWPGTSGLYWVEAEFSSPESFGTHTWAVTCAHGEGFSNFTFITVSPPEHTLTIRVREKGTDAPLPDVEVRMGVYRATSDQRGIATIEVPKGGFSLTVWKVGYENFSTAIDVANSTTVDIEIALEPEPAQPYWM
jgi:hypothetical protein